MDEAQFDALHRSLVSEVYRYAARRSSHETAQDVVAEVFAALWAARHKIPSDVEEQRAWVFGVARRQLARAWTSEERHRRIMKRAVLKSDDNAMLVEEDVAIEVLASTEARQTWRSLPAKDREILSLIAWEELSPPEVALVLGISVSAVTTRLHRARVRLDAIQKLRGEGWT